MDRSDGGGGRPGRADQYAAGGFGRTPGEGAGYFAGCAGGGLPADWVSIVVRWGEAGDTERGATVGGLGFDVKCTPSQDMSISEHNILAINIQHPGQQGIRKSRHLYPEIVH